MDECSLLNGAAEIEAYYARGREQDRFASPLGMLEEARTRDILRRHLPAPPALVLDVGGGPGAHAFWLAELGYETHLLDLTPLHIEQARERMAACAPPLASAQVSDARALPFADESMDAALLLGPLYHLTEKPDRLRALQEALRVLRPGGVLLAAGISRFAFAVDGLALGLLADPLFAATAWADVETGQHRNPENRPGYFTTAYFHRPEELGDELRDAGFNRVEVLAIEGLAWVAAEQGQAWTDDAHRETVLAMLRALEREPSLLGTSAHVMGVGYKRGAGE